MKNLIVQILNMTARRMDSPKMFGGFHIAISLAAAALAVLAAVWAARCVRRSEVPGSRLIRMLAVAGWVLAALEIYKQLFLYYIVSGNVYDWWYFPFQLCSVPMYLCILLPFVSAKMQRTFTTFMSGYTFISAVATLIFPEDLLRPYVSLTLHGFIWHGILLFISLLILFTKAADASARGLARAGGLFAALCVIAVVINMAAEPAMQAASAAHAGIAHSYAAMFYLNPYHISPQPVVSTVQTAAGIPAGLVLYALVIAAVSSCWTVICLHDKVNNS